MSIGQAIQQRITQRRSYASRTSSARHPENSSRKYFSQRDDEYEDEEESFDLIDQVRKSMRLTWLEFATDFHVLEQNYKIVELTIKESTNYFEERLKQIEL